ncbi:MAG: hypothetical protein H0W69_00060 [Gemmatimonadaceae bacterium]|nr:hypothetical protein [Gemmatimonadaceae bacterium]
MKKRYSEQLSECIALACAEELRNRGLKGARPAGPGELGGSGAERRMAGGIGAKKVDVTWATEESGLLLGISIKAISFKDAKTKNFQKNLTNRRGDMLMEAVTLHRRFPYAVLAGFIFFDKGAGADATAKRRSTIVNAHSRLRLYTGRNDPAGRDEQFEAMYLFLIEGSAFSAEFVTYGVGEPGREVALEDVFDALVQQLADRNPDFYECVNGKLIPANG